MKEVFTTTEAAKLCHISKQKIVNLFDEGEIQGFRIPGAKGSKTQARRIPREALLTFMKKHGIPTDALESETKKRVLIVDDDEKSVELLEAILCGEDRLEVKAARSGSDAAVLAGSFAPDLILLDLMLPDLDGDEIFRSIRRQEELRDTKVIVVTALSEREWREKMERAGVDAFMTKPVDIQVLHRKIQELLDLG